MAFLIYIVLAILSYIAYKKIIRNHDYFEKKGLKFSKPIAFIGSNNLLLKKRSLPETVLAWYNEFKSEKIYGMFNFMKPVFIIRDPQIIKKLAVKDFDFFTDHRVIISEEVDPLFGKALISLQGQKWKDMRSTLSPAFTGHKMRLMFDFVTKVGKQTAETLKRQVDEGRKKDFEFKELATKFTVDNIASCAFGISINSFSNPENDFFDIAKKFANFGNTKTVLKFIGYMVMPSIMKFFKIKVFGAKISKFFKEAVLDTIKVREEKGIVRHDMINLLIQAKKGTLVHEIEEKLIEGFATVEESQMGKIQSKRKWDDEDLAAQAFIFFLAGFDTVATTMGFMGYELACNPDVQQKLYEEILAMEEDLNGKTLTYEKLQSMKYMDQVVCEVLRKWPPAPVTDRTCVKDYELEVDGVKFTIEKGDNCMIPIWGMHHDIAYFPNPEKFDPERFSDENKDKIEEYTYLPFGVGPRNCIGSRFALMEVKSIFYYMLMNFKIMKTEKTPIPLEFVKVPVGLKVEKGIWVALEPR